MPRPAPGLPPAKPPPVNLSCFPLPHLLSPATRVLKCLSPGLCPGRALSEERSLLVPRPSPPCSLKFRSRITSSQSPLRTLPAWPGARSVPADPGLARSRGHCRASGDEMPPQPGKGDQVKSWYLPLAVAFLQGVAPRAEEPSVALSLRVPGLLCVSAFVSAFLAFTHSPLHSVHCQRELPLLLAVSSSHLLCHSGSGGDLIGQLEESPGIQ